MQSKIIDTKDENVIDLDFGFESGQVQSITIYPDQGDGVDQLEDATVVRIRRPGVAQETLVFYHRSLAWTSERHRVAQVPLQPLQAPPAPSEEARTGEETV